MQLTKCEVPLTAGARQAEDAAQPGEAFPPAWREIDAALAPILGKRGSAALYERSMQLQLAGAEAESATLLHTVRELLAPLIGPGLTERLLRPVSVHASAAPPPAAPSSKPVIPCRDRRR